MQLHTYTRAHVLTVFPNYIAMASYICRIRLLALFTYNTLSIYTGLINTLPSRLLHLFY